jgi:hypothetical protein
MARRLGRLALGVVLALALLAGCVGDPAAGGGSAEALQLTAGGAGASQAHAAGVLPRAPRWSAANWTHPQTVGVWDGSHFGALPGWHGATPPYQGLESLIPAGDCDAVMPGLKSALLADMNTSLDNNLAIALMFVGYGGGCGFYYLDAAGGWDEDGPPVPEDDAEAGEYSETNTQVQGVDEADFVKNDGGYLYVLADGRFQVIDAWPAAQAHPIASFPLEGTPKKMFVHADTAVIYSSLGYIQAQMPWDPYLDYYGPVVQPGYQGQECTYGYDCDFTGDGRQLKITVLDLSDRAAPTLVREVVFSGSYLNSRRVGDAVHTAVVFPDLAVPGLEVSVQPSPRV